MENNCMELEKQYESFLQCNDVPITVFMRTYNREKYLKLALDSVIHGTFQDYCLIILDNESTDHTRKVGKYYSEQYQQVFYCYRKSEESFTNMQYAISICKTKYIIILHDDDILEPDYLSTMLKRVEETGYAALSCSNSLIDKDGEKMQYQPEEIPGLLSFSNYEYLDNYCSPRRKLLNFPATVYLAEFLKANPSVHQSDAGPCMDDYLFFQICRFGGTIGIIPERLIRYRIHDGQDSNISKRFMVLQLIDYMLLDDYYRKKLLSHKQFLKQTVWTSFKVCFVLYNDGKIDKKEYSKIFDFQTVKRIKKMPGGKLQVILMKFIYKHNKFVRMLNNLKRGIKK